MSSEIQNSAITREEKWCRTCKHYEMSVDRVQDEFGTCHRNAPTPLMSKEEHPRDLVFTHWPLVRFNDHCGEWVWDTSLDSWIDDPDENP